MHALMARPSTQSLLGTRQMRMRNRKDGADRPMVWAVEDMGSGGARLASPRGGERTDGSGEWVRATEPASQPRPPLINAALPPVPANKSSRTAGPRGLHQAKARQQERMRTKARDVERDRCVRSPNGHVARDGCHSLSRTQQWSWWLPCAS